MLKKEVLRRDKDFSSVYKKGKSVAEKYVVLYYLENNLPYNRQAFLASKKVGKSVERNRARRLMKESFRELTPFIKEGKDLIFIARKSILERKCKEVHASMKRALERAGLLKEIEVK